LTSFASARSAPQFTAAWQSSAPSAPANRSQTLATGILIPKVAALSAPEQTYALYLPAHYSAEKRWPIVYVFDPGAHGEIPAALMQAAAEQFGYIIAASNNSQNGPWKPDALAAQTMWNDTHDRLAINEQRVYFAGFSGGARVAAQLAQSCKCAQAVFLSGATFSVGSAPNPRDGFAIFLTAGLLDFNYRELVTFDTQLYSLNIPHFLRRFDGTHQWAPADIWPEAFAWADVLAMKAKLLDRDDAFLSVQLANFTATAQKLEQSGDLYFSWQFLRATVAAFSGRPDVTAAQDKTAALEKNVAVTAGQKREKDQSAEQQALENAVYNAFAPINSESADRNEIVRSTTVEVQNLRDRAAHEKNPEERRVLERARRGIFAYFIESGEPLVDSGDPRQARIYLALAAEARPESAWPQIQMARCDLKMNRKKDALRDLQKAATAGFAGKDFATLPTDYPEFAGLVSDPEFQKIAVDANQQTNH
jgi:hypothetical protein